MDSKTPKISVCIPTYNRAHYIKEAIESVLMQDYENFELIICDDASTDYTGEVVQSYKDPRIRYVRNANNLGQWENSNKSIYLSRGEYVIFMTDDDVMMQGLLKKEVEILERYTNVVFVAPGYYHIDPTGRIIKRNTTGLQTDHAIIQGRELLGYFLLGKPISSNHIIRWIWPSVMIRKKSLEEIGGFYPYVIHGDELVIYKLSMIGDFCQIRDILFQYRYHRSSLGTSASRKGTVFDDYLTVLNQSLEFADQNNILDKKFKEMAYKYFAKKMASFNGALGWIGARYEENYIHRALKLFEIFYKAIKMNPSILLSPQAYAALVASAVLPKRVILQLVNLCFRLSLLKSGK